MSKRALTVGVLTAGLSAGLVAGAISPAAAQGNPVGGQGSVYYLSGAGSVGGNAQKVLAFGNPGDEVYFGDWDNDGTDTPMVNRNGVFYVADQDGRTTDVFAYGNPGDPVLIGDWNGDGTDSIAVRRGNQFLVKDDNKKSGKADSEFFFGNPGDAVLVGDWDGKGGDTLMVYRPDTSFHVANDNSSGKTDYTFFYGNPGDAVIAGDWADPTTGTSGNGADQIAVRRDGNHYFLSKELGKDVDLSKAMRDFRYGEATDTVFSASLPTEGAIDKKRVATYDAAVVGTFEGGETKFAWDGNAIPDTQAGGGATLKHAAGDKQYFLTGEAQFYRGGEPVLHADGTHDEYAADTADVQIHQANDIYISPEGSVVRHESGLRVGELMTWGEVAADNTNFPDIDALTEEWNLVDFKEGDLKYRRAGEPHTMTRVAGEAMFYVANTGVADDTPTSPEAGDTVVTQKTGDYVLKNGELQIDPTTKQPLQYTLAADEEATDKAKLGQAVVAREGQPRMGYTFSAGAWTEIELDNSDKAHSDEAANTYTAPSKAAPLVSTLDEDTTAEVGYYKGGEQLFYLSSDVTLAAGGAGADVAIQAYKGGEPVVTHAAGDAKLDEQGLPLIVGTDKPISVKGDGLGVRRHFG